MQKNITKISNTSVELLHRKIFGHEISDEMRAFLKNLSWSFLGGVSASAIMFFINILAGRVLGPIGFGNYSSILSLATSLAIFILLGNDSSSVRYLSDEEHKKDQKSIFSASFVMTLIQFIIVIAIIFLFRNLFIKSLSLSWPYLALAMIFSLSLSLNNLTDSYLRGFYLIKKQSIIKIISALATFAALLMFFYYFRSTDYRSLVFAVMAGDMIFIILGLGQYYKNFTKFKLGNVLLLFHYNKYMMVGTIALTIISLEQFFIGKFLGTKELGIYSAYWHASFLIISHLAVYFNNIFWPTAIKNKEKIDRIITKLQRLKLIVLPIWVICDSTLLFIIMKLFGNAYPLRLDFVLLFSFAAFASGGYLVAMKLLYIDRVKISSLFSLVTGITLVALLYLTKNITLYLILISLYYLLMTYFIENIVKNDSKNQNLTLKG